MVLSLTYQKSKIHVAVLRSLSHSSVCRSRENKIKKKKTSDESVDRVLSLPLFLFFFFFFVGAASRMMLSTLVYGGIRKCLSLSLSRDAKWNFNV